MRVLVNNIADWCGNFMMRLGRESTEMTNSYHTWLVLSALVVALGFFFLKGNR